MIELKVSKIQWHEQVMEIEGILWKFQSQLAFRIVFSQIFFHFISYFFASLKTNHEDIK